MNISKPCIPKTTQNTNISLLTIMFESAGSITFHISGERVAGRLLCLQAKFGNPHPRLAPERSIDSLAPRSLSVEDLHMRWPSPARRPCGYRCQDFFTFLVQERRYLSFTIHFLFSRNLIHIYLNI